MITYDPGYKNTGSCKSEITYLNGEEGILHHRGYSIEELCQRRASRGCLSIDFGDMPTKKELGLLNDEIRKDSLVDEDIKLILKSFLSLHILWVY